MKKTLYLLAGSVAVLALPLVSAAEFNPNENAFRELLTNILTFTNNVLIPFILGIGFLVFVWGMFRYFIAGGANEEAKEKGKSLMIWATVGFVVIIVFWGIVNLLATSTGEAGKELQNLPTVKGI